MRLIDSVFHRLRSLLHRETRNAELSEELQFHLERAIEENIDKGMSEREARAAARVSFGSVARATEESYEARGVKWVEDFFRDVRYGMRTLARQRSFTLVTVLTLALGIGACTAVFTIIHGSLQLPYANADRLVLLKNVYPRRSYGAASWPDVRFDGLRKPVGDAIYFSVGQDAWSHGLSFLLRTTGDPFASVQSARRAVALVDPSQAISDVTSIATLADEDVAGPRAATVVMAVLGILALFIATIGVYGVTAYALSRREREFGIRIALGSSRKGILKILFGRVFYLLVPGMALGVGLAAGLREWVASLLGPVHTDPVAILGSAFLLCCAAASAALIPAKRTSRIDPMRTLKSE